MQPRSKSVPELDSVYLNEKCQCCVAGDLGKARTGQEEGTQVSEEPSTESKYFHNQSFQGGKDFIFPYWEKNPQIKPSENLIFWVTNNT